MQKELAKQVKSKDPQQRRAAIVALAREADPDALKVLERVYHKDAEASLQQLALESARKVKQGLEARNSGGAAAQKVNQARAHKHLLLAQKALATADVLPLVNHLSKAVQLDGTLKQDPTAQTMVTEIIELPPADGLELLSDPQQVRNLLEEAGFEPDMEPDPFSSFDSDFDDGPSDDSFFALSGAESPAEPNTTGFDDDLSFLDDEPGDEGAKSKTKRRGMFG